MGLGEIYGRRVEEAISLEIADSRKEETGGCGQGNLRACDSGVLDPAAENGPAKSFCSTSDPLLGLQSELQQQRAELQQQRAELQQQRAELQQQRAMLDSINSTMLLILSRIPPSNAHRNDSEFLPSAVPAKGLVVPAVHTTPVDAKQALGQQKQWDVPAAPVLVGSLCFATGPGWLPAQPAAQEQPGDRDPAAAPPARSD
jgi:DNA-binding transcriptional MerR regulator